MEMKKIKINDVEYEVIKDEKEAIDKEILVEKITDYFDDYDYIVGDWAYGKLRLKGFYDEKSKKVKKINNFKNVDEYLSNYCATDCKHYIVKKIV